MEFDPNANTIVNILNNVLKNINEDISLLRVDFKKLNDLVITLSVKVDETKAIRHELHAISSKVELISNRIFELEKAKDKLEYLIAQVDKDNRSHDALTDLQVDKKFEELAAKMKSYDEKMPLLWKIIGAIIVLVCLTLYVTKSYNEVFSILSKLFSLL